MCRCLNPLGGYKLILQQNCRSLVQLSEMSVPYGKTNQFRNYREQTFERSAFAVCSAFSLFA